MASQRFFLMVNGEFVRTEDQEPIVRVEEDGKVYYATSRSTGDLTPYVNNFLERVRNKEKHEALYRAVTKFDVIETSDRQFMLHGYLTPLHLLKRELATGKKITAALDSDEDIGKLWEESKFIFLADQFLNYATLMNYVENKVRYSKKRGRDSTVYQIRSGQHRVLNSLHARVNGVFNPYTSFPELLDYELFNHILRSDYEPELTNIDAPFIFDSPIMRGKINVKFGTSTDIMALMGIKHKEPISAGDLHRLMAGILLRLTYGDLSDQPVTNSSLQLPTGMIYYLIYNKNNNQPTGDLFVDRIKADSYVAQNDNLYVDEYDTIRLFLQETFPSLEGKTIRTSHHLYQNVRSAEFVSKY